MIFGPLDQDAFVMPHAVEFEVQKPEVLALSARYASVMDSIADARNKNPDLAADFREILSFFAQRRKRRLAEKLRQQAEELFYISGTGDRPADDVAAMRTSWQHETLKMIQMMEKKVIALGARSWKETSGSKTKVAKRSAQGSLKPPGGRDQRKPKTVTLRKYPVTFRKMASPVKNSPSNSAANIPGQCKTELNSLGSRQGQAQNPLSERIQRNPTVEVARRLYAQEKWISRRLRIRRTQRGKPKATQAFGSSRRQVDFSNSCADRAGKRSDFKRLDLRNQLDVLLHVERMHGHLTRRARLRKSLAAPSTDAGDAKQKGIERVMDFHGTSETAGAMVPDERRPSRPRTPKSVLRRLRQKPPARLVLSTERNAARAVKLEQVARKERSLEAARSQLRHELEKAASDSEWAARRDAGLRELWRREDRRREAARAAKEASEAESSARDLWEGLMMEESSGEVEESGRAENEEPSDEVERPARVRGRRRRRAKSYAERLRDAVRGYAAGGGA